MVEIIKPPPLHPHSPHSPPPRPPPHSLCPLLPSLLSCFAFWPKKSESAAFFSPVRHRLSGRRVEDRRGYIYSLTSPLKRTYETHVHAAVTRPGMTQRWPHLSVVCSLPDHALLAELRGSGQPQRMLVHRQQPVTLKMSWGLTDEGDFSKS